jgi:hypothetical protein
MHSIEYIIPDGNPTSETPLVALNYNQAKTMEMLCNLCSDKEIADELNLGERRIEGIVYKLYEDCGIEKLPDKGHRSHRQLIKWAIEHNLVRYDNGKFVLSDEHRIHTPEDAEEEPVA